MSILLGKTDKPFKFVAIEDMMKGDFQRLERIKEEIAGKLDFIPVRESKRPMKAPIVEDKENEFIGWKEGMKSILEDDPFNEEEERKNAYFKMFVDEAQTVDLTSKRKPLESEPIIEREPTNEEKSARMNQDLLPLEEKKMENVSSRKSLKSLQKELIKEKLNILADTVGEISDKQTQMQKAVEDKYAVHNEDLLEKVFGSFLDTFAFHWEEIVELLIDDLLSEEAEELNEIEVVKTKKQGKKERTQPVLAYSERRFDPLKPYKDTKSKDILSVFNDYYSLEKTIRAKYF